MMPSTRITPIDGAENNELSGDKTADTKERKQERGEGAGEDI